MKEQDRRDWNYAVDHYPMLRKNAKYICGFCNQEIIDGVCDCGDNVDFNPDADEWMTTGLRSVRCCRACGTYLKHGGKLCDECASRNRVVARFKLSDVIKAD